LRSRVEAPAKVVLFDEGAHPGDLARCDRSGPPAESTQSSVDVADVAKDFLVVADELILRIDRHVRQRLESLELDLVPDTGWTRFPARLSGQPIFYPVLNEAYATKIARDWNTKDPASAYVGHVLRFEVEGDYAQQFPPQRVGGAGIDELWIPAERLEEFNDHIVGKIGLVASYRADSTQQ